MKKIIPDAYNSIYKGCPCEKKDAKFKNVSFSEILKFEKVIGNNNSAEANIAGTFNYSPAKDTELNAGLQIVTATFTPDDTDNFQSLPFGEPLRIDDVTVTLYPAGHILGSAQVLLEYGGQRAVITGDYKTHADSTAQRFELVQCDLFVTEATFGLPVFQHPDPQREMQQLLVIANM